MNILIAGGGSAGHVNPAITIAKMIVENNPEYRILFVGSKNGLEKDLVVREGFDISFIEVEGFKRKLSLKTFKTLYIMIKGFFQSKKIVKKFKPDIAIGTGGFVSGPVLYAAKLYGSKIMIHEQNAYPGVTNKILSRYTDVAMSGYESALKYFDKSKKKVVTGNLIDNAFFDMEKYTPSQDKKTVVIIGGSQGAMTINNAIAEMINEYMKPDDFNLVFAPGKRHYDEIKDKLKSYGDNVRLVDYIYDRDIVYSKADLMITRGGAISIAELMAMGKPAIIIPSPFVPDKAQERNAKYIYDKNACEIMYDDEKMTGKAVYEKIVTLLKDEKRLIELSKNAYDLGIRDANMRVYKEFSEVCNEIDSAGK